MSALVCDSISFRHILVLSCTSTLFHAISYPDFIVAANYALQQTLQVIEPLHVLAASK